MYGTARMVLPLRHRIERVEQREDALGLVPRIRAIDCAAVSVSVGTPPFGRVAAAKSLSHASGVTRVTQPASTSASVAKLAIVGVWPLLSGSWMVAPQPPVARSTKLGTLPAAIFSPQRVPLDRGAVDELVVRPHRRDGRHLVDRDLGGRLAAEHGQQRDGGIVAARLVRRRLAALGDQIQRWHPLAAALGAIEREAAVGAGSRLRQLPGRARARGPQRHRRVGDRRAGAEHLTLERVRREGRRRRNHSACSQRAKQDLAGCGPSGYCLPRQSFRFLLCLNKAASLRSERRP